MAGAPPLSVCLRAMAGPCCMPWVLPPTRGAIARCRSGHRGARHPARAQTGLFALEHFIPLWTVQMPLSLALKAVKRAFVPTGRDLERMCFSTSTLDPRTAEGMSKDLEGMLAMVEGLLIIRPPPLVVTVEGIYQATPY